MGSNVQGGPVASRDAAASPASSVREKADPLVAAVIFALFARTFLFQAFAVPSPSMEKNILTGDQVLVNKFIYAPEPEAAVSRPLPARRVRRGDVIVFKYPLDPRRDFIKRVIGLPGETVALRDRRVFIDGRLLEEPYAFYADDRVWPDDPAVPDERRRRDQLPPQKVPDGSCFVLGDNRDDSHDSRFFGPVPLSDVAGRALFVYWSLAPRPSAARSKPVPAALRPFDLLARTRWDRTFRLVR
jgi:signal peptidase I